MSVITMFYSLKIIKLILKFDRAVVMLTYRITPLNVAELSKLGFVLYMASFKLSEAHDPNKGWGCCCCVQGRQ